MALISLVALFLFVAPTKAQQAEPQLVITWHANTYIPSWFKGKALPTANSSITASLELSDRGKLVNLSQYTIYWYADDQLISGGQGLQKITFRAPSVSDNIVDLRAEVPAYTSGVLKTIAIPVVGPEATIESPFPNGEFHSTPIELRGWPFFFNVKKSSSLNFSWAVNGKSSENLESPEVLTASLNADAPSGSSVSVGLTVSVPGSISDIATKNVNLVFIK